MASTGQDSKISEETILIDCDVHNDWSSEEEIAQYLPEYFRDRGITPPGNPNWHNPIAKHGLARTDAAPENGDPPGSDYELMREQLFDDFGVDYAVLTGPLTNVALALHPNTRYAKAAIEAYNDWLVEEWLERDDRFLGSLTVVPHAPQHAVEEIERLGSHDQMVQVMLPGAHQSPYGDQRYWPIYEAAEDAGLSLLIHTSSASSGVAWAPTTGAGVPLSYFEKHATAVAPLMGQLTSMVFEGVFVEYSDLNMVFVEQRLGWIPDSMWHMDKLWKGLKDAAPWLERRPSEYIRDNVYFSTQPIAEPERPEHLVQLLDMLHADETVVYSSDYPHWDNDNPKAMLRHAEPEMRQRIFSENAREIYGL